MKPLFFSLLLTGFINLLFSCRKNENDGGKPQVFVDSVKLSGFNTVVVFTSLKKISTQLTERGVCWDTAANPTIQANKKTNAGTSAVFSDTLTGLLPSKLYHIRSYVTTDNNVTYSSETTINTKNIALVFDKMYAGNEDSPFIIGIVGNELEGFTICLNMSPKFGSVTYQRLTKIDGDGNILWTRDYNDGRSKEPRLIRKLPDGYIIGSMYKPNYGDLRILLQKFDANGNFLWEREFKKDAQQFLVQLSIRDNLFLVTMRAYNTPVNDDPSREVSLWDFTVDNSGTILSEKQYPNFTLLDSTNIHYNVIETPDKGFFTYCDIGYTSDNHDIMAHLFTPQYSLKWRKFYETPTLEVPTKAITASNGNYIIAGYKYNDAKSLTTGLVVEINKDNGEYVWQNSYSKHSVGKYYSIMDIVLNSGEYYTTGKINSTPFVSKLNNVGKLNWEYTIAPKNGYFINNPQSIYVTSNKDIYLFGVKNNDQAKVSVLFMIKMKE